MNTPKNFKDFGIKTISQSFTGEKIKVKKILNTEITVIDFKIEASKYEGRCLYLQIQKGESKHVVFTSSKYLIQVIEKLTKEQFPFITTIVETDDKYEFT